MAEFAVEKNLITDPEVPLHPYNYSYIRDSFWRKTLLLKKNLSVSLKFPLLLFFPSAENQRNIALWQKYHPRSS